MLRRLFTRWRKNDDPRGEPQAGVIPYAVHGGVPTFLVVTSRRTGRWVFPKGGLMPGLSPAESAAQEALEEAGVEGVVDAEPVGAYGDRKVREGRTSPLAIAMYPMRVTRQLDDWPEKGQRKRHWATLPELRALLTTPGLLPLAERAEARIRSSAVGEPVQAQVERPSEEA